MKLSDFEATIEHLRECPDSLMNANDFQYSICVDYIKKNTWCDSSDYKDLRAGFVKDAIVKLIDEHKEEILKTAAMIAQMKIESLKL